MPFDRPTIAPTFPARADTSPAPAPCARLGVPVTTGHFDELHGRVSAPDEGVSLAPLWQSFFDADGAVGVQDFNQRAQRVARRVRDDGASYNIHGTRDGQTQSWPLELLPVLIHAHEWATIEAGVLQRTRLLNAVLGDTYGPRHLLTEGVLPASLVLQHPQYLRAMHGVVPLGGVHLHVAAFELTRGPDGSWRVLGQRLQAPSGLGYLLENRLVIGSQFPEAFRDLRVQRLAASFQGLLQSLVRLSPATEHSRIVLLTPGPHNETYFEHVFLARYLGITLVEGADLTVRGSRVFLKSLHGLERVHVILRRVDDEFLDPLELRADSALGVPGLVQAMRAGEVVVANSPGAGWLESPGLAAFWPGACERLLGETLALPAVTSWWCGEDKVWRALAPELGEYLVEPTFPMQADPHAPPHFHPFAAWSLPPAQLAAMRQRIDKQPEAHTLRARVLPSETPVWRQGDLLPAAMVLRVFAFSDGLGGWRVLPGAMARVASSLPSEPLRDAALDPWLSMQRGSASADTWVVAQGDVDTTSLLPKPIRAEDLVGWHRPVSSRSAENLFWLGRYSERCENTVRLARVTLESLAGATPRALRLLDALARHLGMIGHEVPQAAQAQRIFERAFVHALGDSTESTSVAFNLQSLWQCAGALRERLSPEHWRLINEAKDHFVQHLLPPSPAQGLPSTADALGLLARLATHLAAITGAQTDRMTRDDGWRLLSIGRQVERLDFLAQALALAFEQGLMQGDEDFSLILDLFDSTITYRAQFQSRRELIPLLHLLVRDTDNPRSLAWVARTMRERFARLAARHGEWADAVVKHLPHPDAWPIGELAQAVEGLGHPRLVALLRDCAAQARGLSDELTRKLFTHVDDSAQAVWQ